jgi:hypothetical protein
VNQHPFRARRLDNGWRLLVGTWEIGAGITGNVRVHVTSEARVTAGPTTSSFHPSSWLSRLFSSLALDVTPVSALIRAVVRHPEPALLDKPAQRRRKSKIVFDRFSDGIAG